MSNIGRVEASGGQIWITEVTLNDGETNDWYAEDAASRWFSEYCDWERDNLPEDCRDRVDLLKLGADAVHIDHLFIDPVDRSKGYGRMVMWGVVNLADRHGISLTLNPAWIGDEEEPFDLAHWYEQFGFKAREMSRQPRLDPSQPISEK